MELIGLIILFCLTLHIIGVLIRTFVVIYFVKKNFSKKLDFLSTFLLLFFFGDPRTLMNNN